MARSGDFLVKACEEKTSSNNSKYLNLKLLREGGEEIPAKVWAQGIGEPLSPGLVICAYYKEDQYEGKPQLIVEKYSIRLNSSKEKFLPPPAVNQDEVFDRLYRNTWCNKDIQGLFDNLLIYLEHKNLIQAVKEAPAASKNHHNRRAGLLQHMQEMWDLSEDIIEPQSINPKDGLGPRHFEGMVDPEIVKAAILFHDLGKIHEYNLETGEYDPSRELAYLGHPTWGTIILSHCWPSGGNKELRLKLMHCVASHHGRVEHGASVPPSIPEATVLHLIDLLSAQLEVHRVAQNLPQGQKPVMSKTLQGVASITDSWPSR